MGAELRIFLTYRHDDSAGQTGRIADRLRREFGEDSLFMDVDGIPLGVDFHKRLNDEVARCDVLIAAIGNRWIDLADENGERRIDNPLDFVRIEISAALRRDIPLIPLLLDGAKIPNPQYLPDDMKGLAFRNGLDVSHATFHSDLDRLVHELRQISRNLDEINWNAGAGLLSQVQVVPEFAPIVAVAICSWLAGYWIANSYVIELYNLWSNAIYKAGGGIQAGGGLRIWLALFSVLATIFAVVIVTFIIYSPLRYHPNWLWPSMLFVVGFSAHLIAYAAMNSYDVYFYSSLRWNYLGLTTLAIDLVPTAALMGFAVMVGRYRKSSLARPPR
jgi:TIR domain